MTTRVYPVADLFATDTQATGLVAAIRKTIVGNWKNEAVQTDTIDSDQSATAPQAAKPDKPVPVLKTAKIVAVEGTGSLIVTQNFDGHQQVLRLLRMLRGAKSFTTAHLPPREGESR